MVEQQTVHQLRQLVHDCLAKHQYSSATFFADKVVTLSNYAPTEVYTLAQAFFLSSQFRRCLMLLKNTGFVEKDLRFRYLAAKCLAECKEWEECLTMLGGLDVEEPEQLSFPMPRSQPGTINYLSVVCLLRGQVYDALENYPRATKWYKAALTLDPFNYEAFQQLVENHKLSNEEELELVGSLPIPPHHQWLHLLYRSKCKKYEQSSSTEASLDALENEPPNRQKSQQPQQPGAPLQQQQPKAVQTPVAKGDAQAAQPMALSPVKEEEGVAMSPGWGLHDNLDVITCRADLLYHRGLYQECYDLTSAALERDPYALECLPSHLASALELRKKNDLFMRAHKLVEGHPDKAVSWFAVGCYYMCTQQFEAARRHFGKATTLDRRFVPAWIGFGHAFAAQDESDQAMAAYRTAHRLFPGLHMPLLGMGMEYMRMNNLHLAEQMFLQAQKLCPSDPLVANELGVLAYRNHQYDAAAAWLQKALDLVPGSLTATWEPTLINLGHALRKLRRWSEALGCYHRALGLVPGQPGTYSVLGYAYHLMGDLDKAIDNYHKALGLRPEDVFTGDMLALAMEEDSERFQQQLRLGG